MVLRCKDAPPPKRRGTPFFSLLFSTITSCSSGGFSSLLFESSLQAVSGEPHIRRLKTRLYVVSLLPEVPCFFGVQAVRVIGSLA